MNGLDGIGALGGNGILGLGFNGGNLGLRDVNMGCCIEPNNHIGLGGVNLGCCIEPNNQIGLNGVNLGCFIEPNNHIGLGGVNLGKEPKTGPTCEILQPCDLPQLCEAQPIVINQDVPVPRPVVVRKQTVPIPFLPYCRRTKRGYPKW